MKIGIVEDEIPSRQVIKNIIRTFCAYANIVAEEGAVSLAISALNEKRPEVIFLDIELRGGSGFDVLKGLQYEPLIIFTTAYSAYALNAIKVRAFDYLLKPIQEAELVAAVSLCRDKLSEQARLRERPEPELSFFSFASLDGTHVIPYSDILYFESSGSYTYCVTEQTRSLFSKHLGEVEKEVCTQGFFRSHHSYILNLSKIERAELKRNGTVFLKGGQSVPVAQRKIKEFRSLIKDGLED
jgi:two-component system, LytTR family, response regulator